jgi:hypothetical protein
MGGRLRAAGDTKHTIDYYNRQRNGKISLIIKAERPINNVITIKRLMLNEDWDNAPRSITHEVEVRVVTIPIVVMAKIRQLDGSDAGDVVPEEVYGTNQGHPPRRFGEGAIQRDVKHLGNPPKCS